MTATQPAPSASLVQTIGANNGGNLMTKAVAAKVASLMATEDPDWTYEVEERGEWAVVNVFDEDGEFISTVKAS